MGVDTAKENNKEKGFKLYYQKYRLKIFRYIYRRISSQDDAEDLTAEVFLKFYENYDQVAPRGEGGVSAWLYTVARNLAIDFLRRNSRRQGQSIEDEQIEKITGVFDDFVGDAMKNEDLMKMKEALAGIDDEEREVLALRFEEDMKFNEIAEVIGKNEGACKMILYRCIEKLKAKLNGEAQTDVRQQA